MEGKGNDREMCEQKRPTLTSQKPHHGHHMLNDEPLHAVRDRGEEGRGEMRGLGVREDGVGEGDGGGVGGGGGGEVFLKKCKRRLNNARLAFERETKPLERETETLERETKTTPHSPS